MLGARGKVGTQICLGVEEADGLELVARHRPDVVLVEHHLPDGDGLSLTRRLKALTPAPGRATSARTGWRG